MDQRKIGAFLKKLRNEKNITQEQLAEYLNVSNRTVSRWETGRNLPDFSLLVELADYYDVDIREIMDGERKNEIMNQQEKEILLQVATYSETEKKKLKRRMFHMSLGALMLLIFYVLLEATNGFGILPSKICENIQDFTLGVTTGWLFLITLYLCGMLEKVRVWKKRLFNNG